MPAEVEVYASKASRIRLELNGDEVRTRPLKNFLARFKLDYDPGTLTAVALDDEGREIARSNLVSAQGSLHLDAHPESANAHAGGIAYVDVAIRASNGEVESNADEQLVASVEGGVLLGFGSARPATVERFDSGSYTTYRGYAQAIVYREDPGTATLTVKGNALSPVATEIRFS